MRKLFCLVYHTLLLFLARSLAPLLIKIVYQLGFLFYQNRPRPEKIKYPPLEDSSGASISILRIAATEEVVAEDTTATTTDEEKLISEEEWHKHTNKFYKSTEPISTIDNNLAAGSRFALEMVFNSDEI